MATKKARFFASVDGKPKELLAIEERKDGDLLLFLKHSDAQYNKYERLVRVSEQRYSVHNSFLSSRQGTTIKHTMRSAGNELIEMSTFVENSKDTLLWLLFTRLCPDFRAADYDLKTRAGDQAVELCRMIGGQEMLYYAVVAHKRHHSSEDIRLPTFGIETMAFRNFSISLLSRKFAGLPVNRGIVSHRATSAEGYNKVKSALPIIERGSMTIAEVHRMILMDLHRANHMIRTGFSPIIHGQWSSRFSFDK